MNYSIYDSPYQSGNPRVIHQGGTPYHIPTPQYPATIKPIPTRPMHTEIQPTSPGIIREGSLPIRQQVPEIVMVPDAKEIGIELIDDVQTPREVEILIPNPEDLGIILK